MEKLEQIKQYASNLRLNSLRLNPQELIHKAQVDNPTYMDFTLSILKEELRIKQEKEQQSRIKRGCQRNSVHIKKLYILANYGIIRFIRPRESRVQEVTIESFRTTNVRKILNRRRMSICPFIKEIP